MPSAPLVIYEQVEPAQTRICDLGHQHTQVKTYRRYLLDVVETRDVPNRYLRSYGDLSAVSTGMRAVDQFGTEWFSDWHFAMSDGWGGGRSWEASDGRKAVNALASGSPAGAHDGWVLEQHDGQHGQG